MSATDPLGDQKYWFNGVPFEGLNITANDPGTVKFWFNGVPVDFIFPAAAAVGGTMKLAGMGGLVYSVGLAG